jgi:hypothetical protein
MASKRRARPNIRNRSRKGVWRHADPAPSATRNNAASEASAAAGVAPILLLLV